MLCLLMRAFLLILVSPHDECENADLGRGGGTEKGKMGNDGFGGRRKEKNR